MSESDDESFEVHSTERDPIQFVIFCDGASKSNGKPECRAAAAAFHFPHEVTQLPSNSIAVPVLVHPSNQHAELVAVHLALSIVDLYSSTKDIRQGDTVYIVTDSVYAIKCATLWILTWKQNNFMTSKGTPVKHDTVIKSIDQMLEKHKDIDIRFQHVRSHRSQPKEEPIVHDIKSKYVLWKGNDVVDRLAQNTCPPPFK
jgi:ribonuclease HI